MITLLVYPVVPHVIIANYHAAWLSTATHSQLHMLITSQILLLTTHTNQQGGWQNVPDVYSIDTTR